MYRYVHQNVTTNSLKCSSTNSETLQDASKNSNYYINEVVATTFAAIEVAPPQKIQFFEFLDFGEFVLGIKNWF